MSEFAGASSSVNVHKCNADLRELVTGSEYGNNRNADLHFYTKSRTMHNEFAGDAGAYCDVEYSSAVRADTAILFRYKPAGPSHNVIERHYRIMVACACQQYCLGQLYIYTSPGPVRSFKSHNHNGNAKPGPAICANRTVLFGNDRAVTSANFE